MFVGHTPPQRIADRYELGVLIGDGGFGRVYSATDSRLNRTVAVKFLITNRALNQQDIQRFSREAQSVAQLSHPNIVQVYDMGVEGDWHYIVMEYVDGKSLEDLIQSRQHNFTLTECVDIIEQTLEGLAHAHEHGLIHRDIKPANLLITDGGRVKITDFGLVLGLNDERITRSDAFVGTILYCSPETLQLKQVDSRTDLYSLGAVFYELVAGQAHINVTSTASIISDIVTTPTTPPSLVNPSIPEPIELVILRLLEKSPNDRYASARDVLDALPDADMLEMETLHSLRRSAQMRLTQPLLQRIIAQSTGEMSVHDLSGIDEDVDDDILGVSNPELLLFAASEDTIEALELERRELATQLQNQIISQINMILTQVTMYEQTATTPQAQMSYSLIVMLIRQLLQQTLDIESNLYPGMLETLGLEPALKNFATQQQRTSGLNIILSVQRLRERLPATLELTFFRAAQDFINHALKRANANQVYITLTREDAHITFILEDNGRLDDANHLRLLTGRVRSLGGSIAFSASSHGGLKMSLEFIQAEQIDFTEREYEVIPLIADGMTNKEIAALLGVRPRTIKFHLDNIFSKLNVNTRTEVAIYAIRNGLTRNNRLTK